MTENPEWLTLARSRRTAAVEWWDPEWQSMKDNHSFYAASRGKGHYTEEEIQRANNRQIALLTFNTLASKIQALAGREVVQRFEATLKGFEGDDASFAKAWSSAMHWVQDRGEFAFEDSQAFLDVFVCRMGAVEWRVDPFEDHKGRIVEDNIFPWEVAVDPSAKKQNLEDRKYLFRFRQMHLDEARAIFDSPEQHAILESIKGDSSAHYSGKEGDAISVGDIYGRPYNPDKNTVFVTHYETRDIKTRYYQDGKEIASEQVDLMREAAGGALVPGQDYEVRKGYVWRHAFLAGDQILEDLADTETNESAYGLMTCWPYKTEDGVRFFCPIDVSRDPIRWRGKMLSLWVDILAVSPKAPIIREEGVYVDEAEAKRQMPMPGGDVVVKRGVVNEKRILFGQTPRFPPVGELASVASSDLWDVLGVSRLNLGQVDDVRRAPAQSIAAIQRAGQAAFAFLYDSLKRHRRRSARVTLKMMANLFEIGDLTRVVGREHQLNLLPPSLLQRAFVPPEQGVVGPDGQPPPPTLDPEALQQILASVRLDDIVGEALKYDISVSERPDVATEAEAMFDVLPQLASTMQQNGTPLPPSIILKVFKNVGLVTESDVAEIKKFWAAQAQMQAQAAASGAAPGKSAGGEGV